jgi:hypothetical protein
LLHFTVEFYYAYISLKYYFTIFAYLFTGFISLDLLAQEYSRAPTFRGKLGISLGHFKLGTQYENEALSSLVTIQPTILWDLPLFRARFGIHDLGEYGSNYGLAPISGIGITSYFYPFGISSIYEFAPNGVLYQKTIPGPFVVTTLTPINFNLNKSRSGDGSGRPDLSTFVLMYEFGIGLGYDYPIRSNMILALEAIYRYASAQDKNTSESVTLTTPTFFFVFSTSYY